MAGAGRASDVARRFNRTDRMEVITAGMIVIDVASRYDAKPGDLGLQFPFAGEEEISWGKL